MGSFSNNNIFFEGVALALPGLLSPRQDPPPLLRLLRPRHDRLCRRDNHLLQRGEDNSDYLSFLSNFGE